MPIWLVQVGILINKALAQPTPVPTNPTPVPTGPVSIKIDPPIACDKLDCVVNKIAAVLYAIAIPVLTVMILIGGFQILTAGGNPEKFKKGRQTIFYAVIGFLAILVADGVYFIIKSIFQ